MGSFFWRPNKAGGRTPYVRWRDATGREHMKSCRKRTRKQAEEILVSLEGAVTGGTFITPSMERVSEFLDRWLDHCEQQGLAATTIVGYRGCVNRYIKPSLGQIPIGRVTTRDLQQFINSLTIPRSDGGLGLATKTAYNIHGVLRKAFKQAVEWHEIANNPMDGVKPPKLRMRKMRAATDAELKALMAEIDQSAYRLPISLALATGMRRGEVLGLKWEDVDADRGLLWIRRAMAQIPGRPPFEKEPKTGQVRQVGVSEELLAALKAHRQDQMKSRLAFEGYAKDEGWICTRPDGTHITPNALAKAFIRIRNRAGAKINFHGLRHTYATELIMAGVPLKVVSELLGHANSSVTQDIYGHVQPAAHGQAIDVISKMMDRVKASK